jgi:hypothetical protein
MKFGLIFDGDLPLRRVSIGKSLLYVNEKLTKILARLMICDAINTLPKLYIKTAKSTDHNSNFFADVIASSVSISGSASNLTRTRLL